MPMDRGAWWAAVHGLVRPWSHKVLDSTEQLCIAKFLKVTYGHLETVSLTSLHNYKSFFSMKDQR